MLVFVYAFSLGSSVELSRKRESNPYPSPLEEGGEMRLLCRLSYLGMCFCNDGGQYKHKVSLSQETYLMFGKKRSRAKTRLLFYMFWTKIFLFNFLKLSFGFVWCSICIKNTFSLSAAFLVYLNAICYILLV